MEIQQQNVGSVTRNYTWKMRRRQSSNNCWTTLTTGLIFAYVFEYNLHVVYAVNERMELTVHSLFYSLFQAPPTVQF